MMLTWSPKMCRHCRILPAVAWTDLDDPPGTLSTCEWCRTICGDCCGIYWDDDAQLTKALWAMSGRGRVCSSDDRVCLFQISEFMRDVSEKLDGAMRRLRDSSNP